MSIKQQIVDEITRQIGTRRHREAGVLSSLDAIAEEVAALPSFYIASDDPGAHGNPGLVLYRTLTQEERAAAKAEGSHLAGDPWSIWLTEDVLAVAEASGLLDESIGTSAASARKWLQEDAKTDQIRRQISHLEAELSRISGEPLWVWEGREGGFTHRSDEDIPAGGALVDYEVRDQPEYAWTKWYASTEAAKAAVLTLWREHKGDLSKNGLNLDADPIRAWITRR